MSNFGDHPAGFFGVSGFYNGVVSTSLRLDKASGGYLHRTPSSASNRRTFTVAFWYKTSIIFSSEASDQNNPIFYADEPSAGGMFQLNISGQGQGAASDTLNELQYYDYDSADSTDYGLETNSKFADSNAWYHIVMAFDTTQGTEANRVKVYINGVQRAYSEMNQHHGAVIQNRELNVNQATPHWIGRNIDTTSRYMNGYLADFNFIDGTQYAASNFGEFNNGIWIPKEPNVTYGTNGFRLQFKQTGTGTASSSTVGADTSGNNNHFTSSGIEANDIVPDCPENNFATWDILKVGGGAKGTMNGGASNRVFTEAALSVSLPANTWAYASQICPSGKWYVEICVKTIGSTNGEISWGWHHYDEYSDVGGHGGYNNNWQAYYHAYSTDHIKIYDESSQLGSNINLTISAGDVLQLAWDIDNRKGWIGLNNTWYAADNGTDGNPSAGTNQTFDFTEEEAKGLAVMVANGTSTDVHILNTGQDSSFAGTKTAQGNTDANGIGDFFYAVPTGFQALCTNNLEDATIGPNSATQADDYFNTVLWTGNGNNNAITGVGFQPDWLWSKDRSGTENHIFLDSSRGLTHRLSSNNAEAETTDSNATISSFDADGFTLTQYHDSNINGSTNVGWTWKANGGTTSTNNDGATQSTVQANTTAGFSIVLYTGTNSHTTVGHGLGAVPAMVIYKIRDAGTSWAIWHKDLDTPTTGLLELNSTGVELNNTTFWNSTIPNSTVLSVNTYGGVNNNGSTFIAYCFAEIDGYSKFGRYEGNGSVDGTFVHTGFRPKWLLIKNIDSNGISWTLIDSVRESANLRYNNIFFPNSNSAENTGSNKYLDILSNGFKLRGTSAGVNSAVSFIYMAFAEAPFKYANAR